MKLVKVLSSAISERSIPQKVLLEISDKLKNMLIKKFSDQTNDSSEQIGEYIEEFEKYKNGLPVQKRDLSVYDYGELKTLIETKNFQKKQNELFKSFKKKEDKIENSELKKTIRKFLEIQDKFGKDKDPSKYKFLDFSKVINQIYPKYIGSILLDKFKKENTNITDDILDYYINQYISNFDELYGEIPPPTILTFSEFEHYIDGMKKGLADAGTDKADLKDIEVVYDDNNLIIFQPKTRDQCIKLKNGRSWCTSREGGSNLFYNYRLDHERTLYYVVDQDKDYNDVDFAVVILVDPDGDMSLADGTNSGRYSGHNNIPWDEITKKLPKLKNLKDLFKPKPLTEEEVELIRKVKQIKVGDNPIDTLGNEKMVELWLEITSPRLSDVQFLNLSVPLKKKYIALGHDLTPGMINNADSETKKYYIGKKIELIKTKRLSQLNETDIAILNLPGMSKIKESLKSKFTTDFVKQGNEVSIKIPSQEEGKYIALYGFDDLINNLPDTVENLDIRQTTKEGVTYSLPPNITRFKNLESLILENIVDELPDNIGDLQNLEAIHLINNDKLKELPSSVCNIENLSIVIIRGGGDLKLPKCFEDGTFLSSEGEYYYKD